MTIAAVISTVEWALLILPVLLVALSLHGFRHCRGTTLAAPCLWVAISGVGLIFGILAPALLTGVRLSAVRYATAALTLCPVMAVLGAKRPQDRGWQWVVLTLWIVLIWPALQAALLPAGREVELFTLWRLFIWGLIGVGMLNYLPTRFWRFAMLVAIGQLILLRDVLGFSTSNDDRWSYAIGIGCLLSAAALAAGTTRASKAIYLSQPSIVALTARWLRFRDRYGSFWALRTLIRVNQSAEQRLWPVRLTWAGFSPIAEQPPTDGQLAELNQTVDSILRRFELQSDQTALAND